MADGEVTAPKAPFQAPAGAGACVPCTAKGHMGLWTVQAPTGGRADARAGCHHSLIAVTATTKHKD